jgi:hypothetical protein
MACRLVGVNPSDVNYLSSMSTRLRGNHLGDSRLFACIGSTDCTNRHTYDKKHHLAPIVPDSDQDGPRYLIIVLHAILVAAASDKRVGNKIKLHLITTR